MISDQQKQFLIKMFQMAIASGHMYPQFAACEAVEETGWGTTQAYLSANNVFGQKAPSALGRDDKVAILPTWEVFNGVKVRCTSHFMIYASISDAFKARMALLRNLPSFYAPALAAMTGEEFIREVCAQWTRVEPTQAIIEGKFYQQFSDGRYEFVHGRWSTDPRRASVVLSIYNAHREVFSRNPTAAETSSVPRAAVETETLSRSNSTK